MVTGHRYGQGIMGASIYTAIPILTQRVRISTREQHIYGKFWWVINQSAKIDIYFELSVYAFEIDPTRVRSHHHSCDHNFLQLLLVVIPPARFSYLDVDFVVCEY